MTKEFMFFAKEEYFILLAKKISKTKTGDKVVLMTMGFEPLDNGVDLVLRELNSAAKRGVKVNLLVDAFSFMVLKGAVPGPLFFLKEIPAKLPKSFRRRMDALEELKTSGGDFAIINKPNRRFSSPYSGRSHIKMAIVNDYIFIGGCNFNNSKDIDIMVGWNDKETAKRLYEISEEIRRTGSVLKSFKNIDKSIFVDKSSELLIDSGVKDQSIIFDDALKLIESASKYVVMTCQYFPNDVTIKYLENAHKRGVNVTLYYNHPNKHIFPLNILHLTVKYTQKFFIPNKLFQHQLTPNVNEFLHAKLLATDNGTLIGSHNYIRSGVQFGTAEIAMKLSSEKSAQSAINSIQNQIKGTSR